MSNNESEYIKINKKEEDNPYTKDGLADSVQEDNF